MADVLRGAAAPEGMTYQAVSTPDRKQARALFDAFGNQVGPVEYAWHNPQMGWDGTSFGAPGEAGNIRFSPTPPPGSGWSPMGIETSDFMDPGLGLMLGVAGGFGAAGMGAFGGAGAGTQTFAPGSFWDGATASLTTDAPVYDALAMEGAGSGLRASGGSLGLNSAGGSLGVGGGSASGSLAPGFFGAESAYIPGGITAAATGGAAGTMLGTGLGSGFATGAGGAAGSSMFGGRGVDVPGLGSVPYGLLGAGAGALLGGMGGGSKPAGNITTVQDIPEWQKPFVMQSLMGAQGLYNSMDKSTPLLGPAQAEMGKTISGQYLMPGANPYLDATFNQAARGVTDQYLNVTQPRNDALFNGPGSLGKNTAYQQTVARNQYGLGENLSNLATNIYGGNYQTERGRQFGAAGAAPQFTNDQASAQFAPHNAYGALVSKPFGQSQTSPYFDNKMGSIFGGALTGAALGRLF